MFSHIITRAYQDSAGATLTGSETISADSEFNFDGSIANGTDTEVDWAVVRANLKSVVLSSDKDMTVKTNAAGGSATDTITLKAGQPRVWSLAGDTLALCPFTADVTKLYITNAATAALKIRALCDQTP